MTTTTSDTIDHDEPLEGEILDPVEEDRAQARPIGEPGAAGGRVSRRTLFGRVFDDAMMLWLALRDERTGSGPKYAVALMLLYLVSPIDLIPDVAPLLGIADDAVIVPLMAQGALRLVPRSVRDEVEAEVASGGPRRKLIRWALIVAAIWLTVSVLAVVLAVRAFG